VLRSGKRRFVPDSNLLLLRNTDDFPNKPYPVATSLAENHRCYPKCEFPNGLTFACTWHPTEIFNPDKALGRTWLHGQGRAPGLS
jgi:hypothetical protein